ncbi:hypothetical protein QG37_01227 [Candidozyma auris]|nr:hypothetical protein QG37_01227 [[Candida] auris]
MAGPSTVNCGSEAICGDGSTEGGAEKLAMLMLVSPRVFSSTWAKSERDLAFKLLNEWDSVMYGAFVAVAVEVASFADEFDASESERGTWERGAGPGGPGIGSSPGTNAVW